MRINKKDTEKFEKDKSSVFRHFLPEESSFSISFLDIDGVHEKGSDSEVAYYVMKGSGILKLEERIVELSEDEVFYAGEKNHVLEGCMELMVVRVPPAQSSEQVL